jgi:hypothetical protein
LKDGIVRIQDAVLIEYFVFICHGSFGYGADPDSIEDFGITLDEGWGGWDITDRSDHRAPSHVGIQSQPEYLIRFLMVSVVTELCCDVHEDQNAAGHADGESGDVYKGVTFMVLNVSESAFQIVFKHVVLRQIIPLKREYEIR